MLYPVTVLTVITFLSILVSVYAMYLGFTLESPAIIYPIVAVPIAVLLVLLYAVERHVVKKLSYLKLMAGELLLTLVVFLILSKQFSTTHINFHTKQEYVLVLFDANEEEDVATFSSKGIFGKELNIYDTSIIHLNRTWNQREDLRINTPKEWGKSVGWYMGTILLKGDTVAYRYGSKNPTRKWFVMNPERYIDSLIRNEK